MCNAFQVPMLYIRNRLRVMVNGREQLASVVPCPFLDRLKSRSPPEPERTGGRHLVGDRIYEPFFLRSAQRFFIVSDSRLLPSGVSPSRFFPFNAGGGGVATPVLTARGEF